MVHLKRTIGQKIGLACFYAWLAFWAFDAFRAFQRGNSAVVPLLAIVVAVLLKRVFRI